MDDAKRKRVDGLFAEALEHAPSERAAWLGKRLEGEPELRSQVERLLESAESDDDFLQPGAAMRGGVGRALFAEADGAWRRPTRIGAFRVEHEIGRGGMSIVYLGERADGAFQQQVALKLIRPGIATDEVLRRFAQERQILASFDHEGIARLYDGGATVEGQPYFAMEFVRGEPIDQYCRAHRLDLDQRLTLFLSVCEAVQYAHERKIVHRDIKPGNILVTDQGRPKLLDFGIAKVLDPRGVPHAATTTQLAARRLTPEYASPEQVRGEPVTAASDVYQLGVLLYLLLTDSLPYPAARGSGDAHARAICEDAPVAPSTVVNRMQPATPAGYVALHDRKSQRHRRRRLRGDLDRIVLMALRKEPERRYNSVTDLAEDIRRHQAGLPVLARPDELLYRVRKHARRHAAAWSVSAALGVAVVALGVAVFANRDSGNSRQMGSAIDWSARLASTNPQAHQYFVRAKDLERRSAIGWWIKALDAYRRVLELEPDFAPALAGFAQTSVLSADAQIIIDPQAEFAGARRAVERALHIDPRLAEAYLAQGVIDIVSLDRDLAPREPGLTYQRAEAALRKAIELDSRLIAAYLWLSKALRRQMRVADGVAVLQEAIAIDPLHPALLIVVAFDEEKRGKLLHARRRLITVLQQFGGDVATHGNLAWIDASMGQYVDALGWTQRGVESLQPLESYRLLADASQYYGRLGLFAEAHALLDRAEALLNDRWHGHRADLLIMEGRNAELAAYVQRFRRADLDVGTPGIRKSFAFERIVNGAFQDGISVLERTLPADLRQAMTSPVTVSQRLHYLAHAYRQAGREADAELLLENLRGNLEVSRNAGFCRAPDDIFALARTYAMLGEDDRALALLEEAFDAGWRDPERARLDPRWGTLRESPRFVALIARADTYLAPQRERVRASRPLLSSG